MTRRAPLYCWLRSHRWSLAVIVRGAVIYPHDIPNTPVRLRVCTRCEGAFQ